MQVIIIMNKSIYKEPKTFTQKEIFILQILVYETLV